MSIYNKKSVAKFVSFNEKENFGWFLKDNIDFVSQISCLSATLMEKNERDLDDFRHKKLTLKVKFSRFLTAGW